MIQSNEFRIGNLFTQKGSNFSDTIKPTTFVEIESGYIIPCGIEISKNWLLQLGAKQNDKLIYISIPSLKAELHIEIFEKENVFTLKSQFCELILDDFKYVHRLQNFIFSLTNRELRQS